MSSRRRSKSKGCEEELILGGFSDSDSSSDSELSETWSELGAQIFGDDENYHGPDGTGRDYDQNIDDYDDDGFDNSCKVEDHQESDVILDMKIDDPLNFEKEQSTTTSTSSSTETDLFSPSNDSISSINLNPTLHNKLFFKCILCPASSIVYFCGQDGLRKHINQVHGNKNKTTTTTVQSTPEPSGIQDYKEPSIPILQPSCSICDRRFSSLEFSNIHYQFHLDDLKCIDYSCKVVCQDLEELKSHTSHCLLAMRCKKETKLNHTLSSINCIFTDCTRGFFNEEYFLRHLKSFHKETPKTMLIKFGADGRLKPADKIKDDDLVEVNEIFHTDIIPRSKSANNLNGQRSNTMRTSSGSVPADVKDSFDEIIELVLQGQGTDIFNNVLERKRKKAEYQRKCLLKETEDQRAQRLFRQSQRTLERRRRIMAEETDDQRAQRLFRQSQRTLERRRRIMAEETDDQRAQRLFRQSQRVREKRQRLPKTEDQKPNLILVKYIEILKCDLCSKDFKRKADLSDHNKIYHPEVYHASALDQKLNREVCEICGKIYGNNYNLKVHSKIHNEKIYTCSFENCTKSFAVESYLIRHISRFHSPTCGQPHPKAHLCDICGQRYSRIVDYKHHKERHSRLLSMRKEAYEKKLRDENPSKSDQEIVEIVEKFWKTEESISLVTDPEIYEEKRAINKEDYFDKIKKKGLQRFGETIEECYDRINRERMEKLMKKREAETEEERLKRRERYMKGHKNFIQKNKEKYAQNKREYQKKHRAEFLAYQRDRWAKMTPEQKAQRLESMRNYQKRRKKKSND